jgi:pyridoxine 5-phosphate synthase
VTTQSGLRLGDKTDNLRSFIATLQKSKINVGIFIDPDIDQVTQAAHIGAQYIEINTNEYSQLHRSKCKEEVKRIADIAAAAQQAGMEVHAGHGLDYQNIRPLLAIQEITGYSIGFAVVARAVFVGLQQATQEMVTIIKGER